MRVRRLLRWPVRLAIVWGGTAGLRRLLATRRSGELHSGSEPWPPLQTPPAGPTPTAVDLATEAPAVGPSGEPDQPRAPARAGSAPVAADAPTVDALPTPTAPAPSPTPTSTDATDEPAWVVPVDATCPVTHPVKANEHSGIYHLPGGLSYERVVPERCYRSPADAESDGFRAAKR